MTGSLTLSSEPDCIDQSEAKAYGMKLIYYLTGQGGRLTEGLGAALANCGLEVQGRELYGDFRRLPFDEQVPLIVEDLSKSHWTQQSQVIANSFGAYLFLHAQSALPPYPGKVLLLSPILGEFGDENTGTYFVPPRANKLKMLAELGSFPTPINCEIHVGSEDWQSNPDAVSTFGRLVGIPVNVVPGNGHMLDKTYVQQVIRSTFLTV
jgi:hypothetical protein